MDKIIVYQNADGTYRLATGVPVEITGFVSDAPEHGSGAKLLVGNVTPAGRDLSGYEYGIRKSIYYDAITNTIDYPIINPNYYKIMSYNDFTSDELIYDDQAYICQLDWTIPSGKVTMHGRKHIYFQYPSGELYLFLREFGALTLAAMRRTDGIMIGYANGLIASIDNGLEIIGYSAGAPNILWRGRKVVGLYHGDKLIALPAADMNLSRRVSWREDGRKVRYEYRPDSQIWVAA